MITKSKICAKIVIGNCNLNDVFLFRLIGRMVPESCDMGWGVQGLKLLITSLIIE